MPEIGQFRHRVTWQKSARTTPTPPGRGGQSIYEYQNLGVFWASVEPLRGAELIQASQIRAETTFKITMRNVGAISPQDRLLFEATGRSFEIVSVYRDMERSSHLIITAVELI